MDLTSAIVGLKQAQVTSQIQFAVAKKILDNERSQGSAALNLVQAASNTGENAADTLAAAATQLSGSIDVSA